MSVRRGAHHPALLHLGEDSRTSCSFLQDPRLCQQAEAGGSKEQGRHRGAGWTLSGAPSPPRAAALVWAGYSGRPQPIIWLSARETTHRPAAPWPRNPAAPWPQAPGPPSWLSTPPMVSPRGRGGTSLGHKSWIPPTTSSAPKCHHPSLDPWSTSAGWGPT